MLQQTAGHDAVLEITLTVAPPLLSLIVRRLGGDTVNLPEAWQPIAEGNAANLMAELARELPAGHPLCGIPVAAIALGPDPDDVLFRVLDGSGRLAVVHLTWRLRTESLPWPFTTLYNDEADWLSRVPADGCETADA